MGNLYSSEGHIGVILEHWCKIWEVTPIKIWGPENAPFWSIFHIASALLRTDQDIASLKTDY